MWGRCSNWISLLTVFAHMCAMDFTSNTPLNPCDDIHPYESRKDAGVIKEEMEMKSGMIVAKGA